MELKEAFGILVSVCVKHNGTLTEHQTIQTALNSIRDVLFPKDEKPVPGVEVEK